MSTPFIASNNQKNNKHKTIIFLQKSLKLVSSSLVTLLFVRYVKANVDFLVQIVHMKARKENLLLFYTWASRKNTLKKFWSKEKKTTVTQPDKWIPGKLFYEVPSVGLFLTTKQQLPNRTNGDQESFLCGPIFWTLFDHLLWTIFQSTSYMVGSLSIPVLV